MSSILRKKQLHAAYFFRLVVYEYPIGFLFWGANVHPCHLFGGLLSFHANFHRVANFRVGFCLYTKKSAYATKWLRVCYRSTMWLGSSVNKVLT